MKIMALNGFWIRSPTVCFKNNNHFISLNMHTHNGIILNRIPEEISEILTFKQLYSKHYLITVLQVKFKETKLIK